MGLGEAFRFLVVGDGDLRGEMESAAADLGLTDRVVFTGWQTDIARVYPALDAVVLTSLNEGTPVSILEAMAAQRPVVATDVGGVRDLMGRQVAACPDGYRIMENGIVVHSRDAGAMARALAAVRADRAGAQSRAERAGRDIRRRYARERMVSDLAALYRSICTD
jgi:glycosyltransferase involved in cell wall biosynthesis